MGRAWFQVLGGLCGAAGVALSAAAAHTGGGPVAAAAAMLLAHAPAFVALSVLPGSRGLNIGGAILAFGVLLFSLDLVLRAYAQTRFFPMAAPIGGVGMILGWLFVAAAGLFSRRG